MPSQKTLIITLPPEIVGGVAIKAKILADHLRRRGQSVTIAHYTAMGSDATLNVPLTRLITGQRPTIREHVAFGDHRCIAIGCRLPELEASYTADSPLWRDLIAQNDRHIAVGGTVLAAAPYAAAGVPHLIWCASDVDGDRTDRHNAMAPLRRIYDSTVVLPLLHRLEKQVLLKNGHIMGVSPYTLGRLSRINPNLGERLHHVPVPIDKALFSPHLPPTTQGRIGFVGRLGDPRKNIGLLLDAFVKIRARLPAASLILVGDDGDTCQSEIDRRNLAGAVELAGRLEPSDLVAFYRSLDVFVIPSLQEGLAIVGLEAMGCGVPVVSTRCGGPESFISDGENGFLTAFSSDQLADAVSRIIEDRQLRDRMGKAARKTIESTYGIGEFALKLDAVWRNIWNEPV
ncbi:MAG: glycosyltransferase family 4 protein [Proteobacteria bacterium]|nr:glycosyltransferase family 4 protein [Pseudomonadota bacterium]